MRRVYVRACGRGQRDTPQPLPCTAPAHRQDALDEPHRQQQPAQRRRHGKGCGRGSHRGCWGRVQSLRQVRTRRCTLIAAWAARARACGSTADTCCSLGSQAVANRGRPWPAGAPAALLRWLLHPRRQKWAPQRLPPGLPAVFLAPWQTSAGWHRPEGVQGDWLPHQHGAARAPGGEQSHLPTRGATPSALAP